MALKQSIVSVRPASATPPASTKSTPAPAEAAKCAPKGKPGKPKGKPQGKPKGRSDPQFLANGLVYGELMSRDDGLFVVNDDYELRISLIAPSLSPLLIQHPKEWLGQNKTWRVYPQPIFGKRPPSFYLHSMNPENKEGLAIGEFQLHGSGAESGGALFIGRNDPNLKGNFMFIRVDGLPTIEPRKFVKIRAIVGSDGILAFDRFEQEKKQ